MRFEEFVVLNVLLYGAHPTSLRFGLNLPKTKPMETTEEQTKCKNCARRILVEVGLYAVCAGPCNQSFHISCIGLGKEQLNALERGIIWLCDNCLTCFRDWKNKVLQSPPLPDASTMYHEITELKGQVSRIINALEDISPNGSSSSIRHSTPLPSSSLLNGSNQNDTSTAANCAPVDSNNVSMKESHKCSDDTCRFQLLLTNIDCSVSENDIKEMVCRCLGAPPDDCDGVVKLVPRIIEHSVLDYVSFKVVLKWRWKALAMQSSTWPSGIKFREFITCRNNVWKPE